MEFPFHIFTDIPPAGHLYFFYGLAFFFLGFATILIHKRSRDLFVARNLWLMAAFGFTHGTYAWLELFLLLQKKEAMEIQSLLFSGVKILLFIASFLFLMHFGLTLLYRPIRNTQRKVLASAVPVILLFFWALPLWSQPANRAAEFLNAAFTSAKYTFGVAGPLLTALGLWFYCRLEKSLSPPIRKKLSYVSIIFLLFAVVMAIVPSSTLVPYIYVQIEIFRALFVVLITYFILSAVNIYDMEIQRKLEKQVRRFEQSEKLISIGRLAAGVAHEINNPLANASLNVEIIRERIKDSDDQEILTRLSNTENNISKAATIARELLQFSRDTETDMIPVDINSIIKGSLTLMEHKFKGMGVHTNLSDIPEITGDPVKLEQVIMNILDNAQYAMQPGDEIRIESSFQNGSVEITVMDSGKGISRDNLPMVFDPFFTTKDIGVGTGLGLSICYGIIDQHKGEIRIESSEGEGTKVIINLPAAER